MDQKINLPRWLKFSFKVFLWIVISLLLLVGTIWLVMQTPSFQNYTTKKVLDWATQKTDHEIHIQNIQISWFDEIKVDGFVLKDFSDDTLASARTILVNYDFGKLIGEKTMGVESIHLESGALNLTKYSDSIELNLTVFLESLKSITGKDTTTSKPITLDRVILEDFVFEMDDESIPENKNKIDFSHLSLDIRLSEITDISVKKDSIAFNLLQFLGSERRNRIVFKKLNSRIGFTNKYLVFDDLLIETEYSLIRDSIHLSYENPSALSNLSESVEFFINVRKSRIHPSDVRALTGSKSLKGEIRTSFQMVGTVGDIKIENFDLLYGKSHLRSSVSLTGLPVIEETFMDISVEDSRIYASDIQPYAGKADLVNKVEYIDAEGQLTGFMNNFSTKIFVKTPFGEVIGDVNVTIPVSRELTSYTGHLELLNFDVGAIVGDTSLLQRMTLRGTLIGKGISKEKVTFLVDMKAREVGINNYVYDSLTFKGFLAANRFYGHFRVTDPNLRASGKTNVDLRNSDEKLSLNVTIDTLFTKELNLTSENFFIRTKIDWNQTYLELDSLVGSLKLSESLITKDSTRRLEMDAVLIKTDFDSTGRLVTLEAPGINSQLKGDYTFSSLTNFFKKGMEDISKLFHLNEDSINYETVTLKAELDTKLSDVKPYLDFFSPTISISKGATMEMGFEQKEKSDAIISVFVEADSIVFGENVFLKNEVDVFASLSQNSNDVLAQFLLTSQDQHWKTMPSSREYMSEGVWSNNKIDLTTNIKQPETNTKAKIRSEVLLSKDSIEVRFQPSEIVALGNNWTFNPRNLISITQAGVFFDSLEIDDGEKLAAVNGLFSDALNTNVNMVYRNIDLDQFNSILGLPVEGIFDAHFSVTRKQSKPYQFEGNLNLYDFFYKDARIGDIKVTSYWDEEEEGIRARVSVDRENFKTIRVDGYYRPLIEEQLDFRISFDQADFKMLEAFTNDNLADVTGIASGDIKLTGTPLRPVLDGDCVIEDGSFMVNYLQTNYQFGGKVVFQKDEIDFKNFVLKDGDGDTARFSGKVNHNHFEEIIADLKVTAKDFSFLNTKSTDNDLYYGSAVASGDIFITGPLNDLLIEVNAKTEKGTRFFIPLADTEDYTQAEFINFIDLSDTSNFKQNRVVPVDQNLSLTMDFDLEVTPDAYVELIFDIKTGDIIRGRGAGNLNLKLDKNGNFEMFGSLTISEGAYNFTVPNFINKEFDVVSGGTIVWYGDPYSGSLDLTATYLQKVSFGNLNGSATDQDASMTQKYPVLVGLKLKGDMLSPDIKFDLGLDESASFAQNQEVTTLMNQIRSDKDQLSRQVVSLLFFKKFSPLQSGFVGGGGGESIGKSVSEFLTNQISYLASQLDENLEVEVALTDLDTEGFDTFQLRLAYTLLDGRLKVARGGDFLSATSENTDLTDIIGDWSVEYMLTKDGKLRAKMFSHTNQNLLSNQSQQNLETGLSLRYIKSFNTFREILIKNRLEAIQRKEDEGQQ